MRYRFARRAALLWALGGLLAAGSCEGNVGSNVTGPVTFRLSVGTNNEEAAGVSSGASATPDGLLVAFSSTATNISINPSSFEEIFIKNRLTGVVQNVTQLAGLFSQASLADCVNPFLSTDGAHVVFESKGSLNGSFTTPQATKCIWLATVDGSLGLRQVVFASGPGWPTADCLNASVGPDGASLWAVYQTSSSNIPLPALPAPGVNPGTTMIYAIDLNNVIPANRLISHPAGSPNTYPAGGNSRDATISADGQFVVFSSTSNLTGVVSAFEQIYRYELATNTVTLVSNVPGSVNTPANEACLKPSVSADGRYVAFTTLADDLGAPPLPSTAGLVVVRDMTSTALGSVAPVGPDPVYLNFGGNKIGFRIGMSDDGRFFAYAQRFGVAVTSAQISFVDRLAATSQVVSVGPGGGVGDNFSLFPLLNTDGRWVFWNSGATNLVLDDKNFASDVFGRGPLP